MTRILIADDHRLTVDGTVKLLWEEWPDLLTAFTVPDAIRQVDLHKPDLILLDLQFRDGPPSGFTVLEHCRLRMLPTRILVTSAFDDPETIHQAHQRRADGFIGKHRSGAELIAAIRTLLEGSEWWPPIPEPLPLLAPSHRRVLAYAAQGMSCAKAAQSIGIAEVSVEKCLQEARKRLGARNTAHAVLIAERRGLLLDTATDVMRSEPTGPAHPSSPEHSGRGGGGRNPGEVGRPAPLRVAGTRRDRFVGCSI